MKYNILKLSTVVLLFVLFAFIDAGCQENNIKNDEYTLIKNVKAVVANNHYQKYLSDYEPIWSLRINEEEKKKLDLDYSYFVPKYIPEDYKIKELN